LAEIHGVVSLSGCVDSFAKRAAAEDAALHVGGIINERTPTAS
jgi:osmotically-inducible protein OsmY